MKCVAFFFARSSIILFVFIWDVLAQLADFLYFSRSLLSATFACGIRIAFGKKVSADETN